MNFLPIKEDIYQTAINCGRKPELIQLLIASKNQPVTNIKKVLELGHRLFGENLVQEAWKKWPVLKQQFPNIELHLIGHLQTNKVKEAVQLFDVIQTLDSIRLAEKLSTEEIKQNKKLRYLIEINMGEEIQKTGVEVSKADEFIQVIKNTSALNLIGVMCIPPRNQDPTKYFKALAKIAKNHQLSVISMGMSDDFKKAIECGSTMVRIGEAVFGKRD